MSLHCKPIREKFSHFLKNNRIELLSDIFERMDFNRRIQDALAKLQQEEGLSA
jgi:hypothetical protein